MKPLSTRIKFFPQNKKFLCKWQNPLNAAFVQNHISETHNAPGNIRSIIQSEIVLNTIHVW